MWGVTGMVHQYTIFLCVSIHTPVWGVTYTARAIIIKPNVSIHTPVWGVTISVIYSFSFH